MAASDIYENRGSRALIRTVATSTTINLADLQLPGETVTGFTIAKLIWSGSGVITLVRNGVTIANLNGNQIWPLDDIGIVLSEQSTQPLTITMPINSTIIIEVNKQKA
jgi:hypothetical protein